MTNALEFINLIINICSQGCLIIISDLFYKKFEFELLLYLPKNILYINTKNICRKLSIRGIGSNYTIDMKVRYYLSYCNRYSVKKCWAQNIYPNITISESPNHPLHLQNQSIIDKLVHYLYTHNLESPSLAQLDLYKKKLWNFMYDDCFSTISILCLVLCNEYLVSDVKKIIIGHILTIEKWSNLGFYCR